MYKNSFQKWEGFFVLIHFFGLLYPYKNAFGLAIISIGPNRLLGLFYFRGNPKNKCHEKNASL